LSRSFEPKWPAEDATFSRRMYARRRERDPRRGLLRPPFGQKKEKCYPKRLLNRRLFGQHFSRKTLHGGNVIIKMPALTPDFQAYPSRVARKPSVRGF
jgi:hypothetical protein